jgi:hypothetical protein
VRFATILVSNVDANTVIYTGRQSNKIVVGAGVDFPGTLIGSSGLQGPSAYLDPNVWFRALSRLELPPVFVQNTIKYANRLPFHLGNYAEFGGMGLIYSQRRTSLDLRAAR